MTFTDLLLPTDLIAALAKQQISDPTPIQSAALPVLMAGKDAYLNAETGTGKTLAYLLPLFTRIDPAQTATQVVIVAPTHELAIQIHRQSCDLAQNAGRAIRSVLLIGGTATDRQIEKLKAKPHVVVGSPGRIVELIERGKLKTAHIRSIVVDEADRLLSDESLKWIQKIVRAAPPARQLIFASATIEPQTRQVMATLSPDALMLAPGTQRSTRTSSTCISFARSGTSRTSCVSCSMHSMCRARSCSYIATMSRKGSPPSSRITSWRLRT